MEMMKGYSDGDNDMKRQCITIALLFFHDYLIATYKFSLPAGDRRDEKIIGDSRS
jgi:hypothetical protein